MEYLSKQNLEEEVVILLYCTDRSMDTECISRICALDKGENIASIFFELNNHHCEI